MSKFIQNTIIVLVSFVIACFAFKLAIPTQQMITVGGPNFSRASSISGTPTYLEEEVYVRAYATTSIIARNVTSSDMFRYIQNVGDQPVTLWLFADATTTQPSYTGGFIRLLPLGTTTGTDAFSIDLSWFRGSVYAITEDSNTSLKVITYP